MEGLLAGCYYAYFAQLTCSSPPESPVLFKWLINKARGDSDESRANNSIANTGISSPRLSIEYKWTAASYINSLAASRILNSSVSWLSKDRVDSILSGWLGRSHIFRVCKVNYNHITRLWMAIDEMTHTLDIYSRKKTSRTCTYTVLKGKRFKYHLCCTWLLKKTKNFSRVVLISFFGTGNLLAKLHWSRKASEVQICKRENLMLKLRLCRLTCRFGQHFLLAPFCWFYTVGCWFRQSSKWCFATCKPQNKVCHKSLVANAAKTFKQEII